MGCCQTKRDKDSPLLGNGSIDYADYFKENKNKTQYVAINDAENDNTDAVPNLTTLDNFNKNVKNRTRQSSQTSQNSSLTKTAYDDMDWKPFIVQTYKIELKSITDFGNKELLTLLELYKKYYNDSNKLNNISNKNGYESFLCLYNWYQKDGKKGGKQEKLKRIKQFSIDNNIWQLPIDMVNYFNEYYVNKSININGDKYKYYVNKMKEIICMNQSLLDNIGNVQINGITLYYKIYYPQNDLYLNRIPLLLISECGQCKEDWLLLPKLLSLNRTIITFDMRGIGQTAAATANDNNKNNNYSIDLLSSDVAGLIEKLSYRKIIILGNGILGGIIAQTLCVRFENLNICGLILINTLLANSHQPKNIYLENFNLCYSQFKNRINSLNKNKNKNDFIHIGCVEFAALNIPNSNDNNNNNNKVNDDAAYDMKEGEMDMKKMDLLNYYYPFDSIQSNKYKTYSFIMGYNKNNTFPFGPFATTNGNIPYSLLNRPINGITAQQNAIMKLLSTKTNVISSRINEIKQSTLILSGGKNIIAQSESVQYLSSKLINVELKEIHLLKDVGHLWWITHSNPCVKLIDDFIFKIETNLLVRYDVIISNINKTHQTRKDEYSAAVAYKIIITSTSFITDQNNEFVQTYEISNNDMNDIQNMCCKFLCVAGDLGQEKLQIKIIDDSNGNTLSIAQCMLTEAYNIESVIDVKGYCIVHIKHGWNKYEQQRLDDADNAPDMITPSGEFEDNRRVSRLDTDDLDGLDL